MSVKRIVPNISSSKLKESKRFYRYFLGLQLAMDMGWILTFASENHPQVQISIVSSEEFYEQNSMVTAIEAWGVKRFFVKDPNGVVINVMCHL